MKQMKTSRLLAAIGSALITAHAHAGLIGDTVSASWSSVSFSSLTVSPASATVGTSGPEFALNIDAGGQGRKINIDVQDTFISFTYNNLSQAGFGLCDNNCLITISGIDDVITGVDVIQTDVPGPLLNTPPPGPNTASFTDHSITLSIDGLWDTTDTVSINITSRRANVPEPGSLALLGLGLAGLGALRRKRN